MFWKNNKVVLLITSLFLLIQLVLIIGFDSPRKKEDNILPKEIVLTKGMKICAETENDSICISAIDENKRSIFWGREHIIITLVPRQQRWHGKLGLISPRQPNNLWKSPNGVIRLLVQEAEIKFDSTGHALKGINFPGKEDGYNVTYNDNGLLIIWHSTQSEEEKTLDLMLFQMIINGKKPSTLPGSNNDKINVTGGRN